MPADVISTLGRERVVSLKTSDYSTALRLHSVESEKFAKDVNRARGLSFPAKEAIEPLDTFEAYRLVQRYFEERRSQIGADGISRTTLILSPKNAGEQDHIDIEAELDTELVSMLDPNDEDGQRRVSDIARTLTQQSELRQPFPGAFTRELAVEVRKALTELAEEERAFFLGQPPSPSHRTFTRQPKPSITFGAAADKLLRDVLQVDPTRDRTQKKQQATLAFLCRHFGRETPIVSLKEDDLIEFRDLLGQAPANATKRFGRDIALRELVKRNSGTGYAPMSIGTQKTYLEMAHRLFAWAVKREHIRRNPVIDLSPRGKRINRSERRDPYTNEELNKIFNAPIYTGCVNDENGFGLPGPNIIKRSRYWVPLIALFTGMRAEEILQITPSHVRRSAKGTPFFALTPDMMLKNENSIREVPIHRTLVAAGFLEFVAGRKNKPALALFDDVRVGVDGTRSGTWTKRYATFLRRTGVKHGKNCFHSFRHTFRDAIRNRPIPEEQGDMLQGWGARESSASRGYGSGYKADQLAPYMAMIEYEALDLSHIAGLTRVDSA